MEWYAQGLIAVCAVSLRELKHSWLMALQLRVLARFIGLFSAAQFIPPVTLYNRLLNRNPLKWLKLNQMRRLAPSADETSFTQDWAKTAKRAGWWHESHLVVVTAWQIRSSNSWLLISEYDSSGEDSEASPCPHSWQSARNQNYIHQSHFCCTFSRTRAFCICPWTVAVGAFGTDELSQSGGCFQSPPFLNGV